MLALLSFQPVALFSIKPNMRRWFYGLLSNRTKDICQFGAHHWIYPFFFFLRPQKSLFDSVLISTSHIIILCIALIMVIISPLPKPDAGPMQAALVGPMAAVLARKHRQAPSRQCCCLWADASSSVGPAVPVKASGATLLQCFWAGEDLLAQGGG